MNKLECLAHVPPALETELLALRARYGPALRAGAAGAAAAARRLHRQLTRVVAREARRTREERGLSMKELAMLVDGTFPELRRWTAEELEQWMRRKMAARLASSSGVLGRAG